MRKDGISAEDGEFCKECYEDSSNEATHNSRLETPALQEDPDHCCCCCGCCASDYEVDDQIRSQENEDLKITNASSVNSGNDERSVSGAGELQCSSLLFKGKSNLEYYEAVIPSERYPDDKQDYRGTADSDSQYSACCECCYEETEKGNEQCTSATVGIGESRHTSSRQSRRSFKTKHRRKKPSKKKSSRVKSPRSNTMIDYGSCADCDCCADCCPQNISADTEPKTLNDGCPECRVGKNDADEESCHSALSNSDSDCSCCEVCAQELYPTGCEIDRNSPRARSRNFSRLSSRSGDRLDSSRTVSVQDSGVELNEAISVNADSEDITNEMKELKMGEDVEEYCEQCALGSGYSSDEQCECEQCQPQAYHSDGCEICGFRGYNKDEQGDDGNFHI